MYCTVCTMNNADQWMMMMMTAAKRFLYYRQRYLIGCFELLVGLLLPENIYDVSVSPYNGLILRTTTR